MKDKIEIRLRIAGVNLELNINRDEEELLRNVAKEVNHAYEAFSKQFPNSDPREVLAKVTLLFAKGFLTMSQQSKELDRILEGFESQLDSLLTE